MPVRITADQSVATPNVAYSNPGSATPDTFTLDQDAFLWSYANDAVQLFQGWKSILVNGIIGSSAIDRSGLYLAPAALATASNVTVGLEGEISGNNGIYAEQKANITNNGTIRSTNDTAIQLTSSAGGDVTIRNTGAIWYANVGIGLVPAGTHTIINSGTISPTSSGSLFAIQGSSALGIEKITNSGLIAGSVSLGGGDDTLTNSGQMSGVSFGTGNNTLTNSGQIQEAVFAGGNDTVTNSGSIAGMVALGDGTNTVKNTGAIYGNLTFGTGIDTLVNSGTLNGLVSLGDGADKVTNTGTITDFVDLGLGDDVYTGGTKADWVLSSWGHDTIKLNGGNDIFRIDATVVPSGTVVDGGTGIDAINFNSTLSSALYATINLDTIAHDMSAYFGSAGSVTANSVTVGSSHYVTTGFEDAVGYLGLGGNVIYGSAAGNTLWGYSYQDYLFGFAGADTLNGGGGGDVLVGGAGKDTLYGGFGGDLFSFLSVADSGTSKAARDVIMDFEDGLDYIDLSWIDANSRTSTNDTFNFIGVNANFTGTPGQLRVVLTESGHIVSGDVNGDKKPDFAIEVYDPTHNISFLDGFDFIL